MAEASYTPAAPKRERKTVDPQALVNRQVAGVPDSVASDAAAAVDVGPKVLVNIPHDFILTDDGRIEHKYKLGRCEMPRAHFEHAYSKANGVTAVE